MKSILKGAALLSAAALIASCDSSSGGGSSTVTPTPTPQASVTGSAIKGVIDGASVSVTDSAGNVVGSGTVTAGVYDITYDADQAGGTLTPPLIVTVTGGTTVCDFDRPNTANDCATGDAGNPFVSFGQTYTLPADNVVRTIEVAVTNGNTNNTSGATELAVLEAIEAAGGVTALTTTGATTAINAIGGLIELLTGVDLGDDDITQIGAADINSNGGAGASTAQLALAAFNAAILSLQDENTSLAAVFELLGGFITLDANGNVQATGTNLGAIASAVAQGLNTVGAASGNGTITNAASVATTLAGIFTAQGDTVVTIPPSVPGGADDAISQTKTFVNKLGSVLGDVLESTGAAGFGGSENTAATEAFAAELDAVAAVTSRNATIALNQLDAALIEAAATLTAEGATVTSVTNAVEEASADGTSADDGVEFVLTLGEDGTLTATDVSSRWPLMSTAENNQVTLTAATGSANGEGTVSIPELTLTSNEGTSVAQVFIGSYTSATNEDETNDFDLTGTITATETGATSFGIAIDIDNLTEEDEGSYSVAFTFESAGAPNLSLTFNGEIGAQTQSYDITTPSGTITGTVSRPEGASTDGSSDTVTFSDGTAFLTTTLEQGSFTGGTLTVGTGENATTTGTLDTNGVVTYTDESVQALPAIIF